MLDINIDAEEAAFQTEVAAVKEWWSQPRWKHTKRPFTAEQIVSKRGNLKIDYPGNKQSKKLWGILEERFAVSHILIAGPMGQLLIVTVDKFTKFHLWMFGPCNGHPDGQVP